MGTDIHGGFIKVVKDKLGNVVSKQPIKTNWNFDRNYTLFAILAGVRNGYGFAGCYRHEPLQPIAEGRGIPEFISVVEERTEELYNKYYGRWDDEEEFGCWLGDHSYTHMTVNEILEWKGWNNHLSQGGVVSVEHYEETVAKGKEPESWCGGISGGGVVTVAEDEYKSGAKATHVKCFWKSEQSLGERHDWFLEEIERIKNEYGEDVYLVIGFDN
jgi:hypothetical protein